MLYIDQARLGNLAYRVEGKSRLETSPTMGKGNRSCNVRARHGVLALQWVEGNRGFKPLQQEDGTRSVPTTLQCGWRPNVKSRLGNLAYHGGWEIAVENRSNKRIVNFKIIRSLLL